MSKIEPITKITFKGSSNAREWQLMEKLAETIEEVNRLSEYIDNLQRGAAALLKAKS